MGYAIGKIESNPPWAFLRFILVSLLLHIGLLVALGGFPREVEPQGWGGNSWEMVYLSSMGNGDSGVLKHSFSQPLPQSELGEKVLKHSNSDPISGSPGVVGTVGAKGGQISGSSWGDPYLTELRQRIDKAFVYPRISLRRGEEGTVRLQLEIDEKGKLTQLSVLKGSGYAALDEAALRATRQASPFFPPPLRYANVPHTLSFVISLHH